MGKFKPLSGTVMILLGAVTIVACSIIMGRKQLEAQSPQIQIEYLPDGGVRFHLIEPKSVYETGWKPEDWFEGEKTLALCHAIIKQDVEEMQRLIDEGADVNARGKEDMPLLLWAYHSGEPTMECLLKNGADPNFLLTSNYAAPKGILLRGSTLLLLAVRGSSVPKYENYVNLLLKYGANPNLGKPSPLAYAASGLDTEKAFQSLIKAGADPNYNAGDARYLVTAANWFNAHRVNALLERGATYDINTLQGAQLQRYLYRLKTNPNFGVSTPEREKAIKWLEAHGVSFDEPAPLLPEEIEREEKRKKEAEALRRVAEKEAAYQSKLEYASKKAKATLSWYQGEDETTFALCQAIVKRDVEEMQRLIDKGANVNAKGNMNFPLLWWASPLGEQALECLLKNGADPNVFVELNEETKRYLPPCLGNTLLEVATELAWDRAYENDVDLLLKYGAEPRFSSVSLNYFATVVQRPQSCRRFVELLELGAEFDVNSVQGKQLQRILWDLKNRLRVDADHLNDINKAIEWMEARGVSFDKPAPLLPEEVQ